MNAEPFKVGDLVRVDGEREPGTIVGLVGRKFHVRFGNGRKAEYNFYWPRQMTLSPEAAQEGAS